MLFCMSHYDFPPFRYGAARFEQPWSHQIIETQRGPCPYEAAYIRYRWFGNSHFQSLMKWLRRSLTGRGGGMNRDFAWWEAEKSVQLPLPPTA